MSNPYYLDYSSWLSAVFEGKVQKITVDVGLTCPNRDGTKGIGGCAYCNNASFSPDTAPVGRDILSRIEAAKRFFAGKYRSMRYIVYLQSHTNTYGNRSKLLELYDRALGAADVAGLIIGTRPDCVDRSLLDDIRRVAAGRPVIMEYGAESSHDSTLERVNRCHSWADTVRAVRLTSDAGLYCGLHFILGLPGETVDMMLQTIDRLNLLPVDCVKFHQLQIIRGTALARLCEKGEAVDAIRFTPESYAKLCACIVRRLRPGIAVDRFVSQAPVGMVIAPCWGLKPARFMEMLRRELATSNPSSF